MSFVENLRSVMAERGVDQSELGRRLGITSQAVNQWLSGGTLPKGARLDDLAKVLDVSVNRLFRPHVPDRPIGESPMAMPESPILPPAIDAIGRNLERLVAATNDASRANRETAVATLAAAIIVARGKPISIEQALSIANDVRFAMSPPSGGDLRAQWDKTRAERIAKIHD